MWGGLGLPDMYDVLDQVISWKVVYMHINKHISDYGSGSLACFTTTIWYFTASSVQIRLLENYFKILTL